MGVTTLDLGDRQVEVWYPADPKATKGKEPDSYFIRDRLPAAIAALLPVTINPPKKTTAFRDVAGSKRGPFPLVTFSHGAAGYREQPTFLTAHIASWGFVVTSPEFLEYVLTTALGQRPITPKTSVEILQLAAGRVREASASKPGVLSGLVRKGKIGAVGHSTGARASIELAAAEPSVATYVALAGTAGAASAGGTATSTFPAVVAPDVASMYIAGREDGIADVQPVTKHYTVAQLRYGLGLDKAPVGLAPRSAKQFGDVAVAYSTSTGKG